MEAETGPVNHVLRRDLARLRSGRVAVGPNQNGWPCGSANNKHVLFGPNAATTSSAFYIILSYLTELLVRFIGGGDNVTMNILLLWKSVL